MLSSRFRIAGNTVKLLTLGGVRVQIKYARTLEVHAVDLVNNFHHFGSNDNPGSKAEFAPLVIGC